MRVLLDPQVFLLGYCGLLKYYTYLFHELKNAGIDIYSPVVYSSTRDFPGKYGPLPGWLPSKAEKLGGLAITQWTRRTFYKEVAKKKYDVLFITSDLFETGFLKYLGLKPFVMTVHDTMIGVNGNGLFLDPNNQQGMRMGFLAHQSKQVISVSNHTTQDLTSRFMIDPNKINTIYHSNFLPEKSKALEHLPEQYVLFVGNRNGRKNFLGWIKAVGPYLKSQAGLKVVVTGELTEYEQFFLDILEIKERVISMVDVTDAQLNFLYRKALCLIYPSLYEGFGLPVLEAMANGCPVITTNRSSLPEVAGEAALYIDPESDESILRGLKQMVNDAGVRTKFSEKGILQSRKFSKEKFIQQVIHVLKRAAK